MTSLLSSLRRRVAPLRDRWASWSGRQRGIAAGIAVIILVIVLAIIFSLCSGGSDDEPVAAPPETTLAPTTSATPETVATTTTSTTTTAPAGLSIALADAPEGLLPVVEDLYAAAAGDATASTARLAPDLVTHLAGATPPAAPGPLEGGADWAQLPTGSKLAVAAIGADVVLAVDDGDGWRVVGAKLASMGLDAWYGGDPRLVLVIGSDARWNEDVFSARADSLHVLTSNLSTQAGAIVGIPRDSWLARPGGGNGKVTDYLAAAGPDGVLELVRNFTGLPLEGYLITGFLGFEQLIDDFGGLTITLPERIRGGLPGFPDYPAGEQTLDGTNLLLLARIRKTLPRGDFDRSFNHGLMMEAGLETVQERGVLDLPRLLWILVSKGHTDLTAEQLLTLGAGAYELDPNSVFNMVLDGRAGSVGDASVVFVDEGAAAEVWQDIADGALDTAAGS